MLKQRILSALVLLPVTLLAWWAGGWAFTALLMLLGGLMGWEWVRLCRGRYDLAGVLLSALAVAVAGLGLLLPPGGLLLTLLGAAGLGLKIAPAGPGQSRLWLGGGAVYLCLPVLAVVWLRQAQPSLLLWLLLLVWATDIGAYAAGRSIGGPKLLPKVSPKKTWAGLLGGMSAAALVGALLAAPGLHGPLALASAGLAVIAQAGDLFESWVKRLFNVKDSSALIPGHGGVLDRLDGFLTTAPLLALVAALAGNAGGWLRW